MSVEERQWWNDDDFWVRFGPSMFTEQRWAAACEEVSRVLELADTPPGAAVLDLACGPGRHSLELARRGFRVTGVDRTAPFLDEAQRRAHDEGLHVDWVHSDLRDFAGTGTFDLVLSLFTSFGYFDDEDEDARVLERLRQSLAPGATLVLDVAGSEIIARRFHSRHWEQLPDGSFFLQERRVAPGWEGMDNRWLWLADGNVHEYRVRHRQYSGGALRNLLERSGYTVEIYGGLDGRAYDHEASRLVAVARVADQSEGGVLRNPSS